MTDLPNGRCQRCFKETHTTTMSRFNTQHCCMECIELEKQHPSYHHAEKEELKHIKMGNYNFCGVGLPPGYFVWAKQHQKGN
jgi:hypothetical protein